MRFSQFSVLGALVAGMGLSAACGGSPRAQLPSTPPPPEVAAVPAVQPAPPQPDLAAEAIARSQAHFASGERELALGHLGSARAEFDLAVDVLLAWPGGARSDARIQAQLNHLVDRISAIEAAALAAGDGFTEIPDEPASIDELLAAAPPVPPALPPGLARAVEAELASTSFELPIIPHDKVLGYVDLYTGRLREWFEASLRRGTRYLPMIQGVLRAEGLPTDLAYIALVESAFKPTALSRAKARGVWQFMRATARENGLQHDWYIDERADPEKATRAAARYLKTLRDTFDGDWLLALASYNGGPGRVQRAIRRAGTTDFWRLSASSRYLPRETRNYVPAILAAMLVARDPQAYALDLAPESPVAYESVPVPRAVDLRRVAEWTGASIEEIQALNPELRRWVTPARAENYEVKVPVGTGARLSEGLAEASPSDFATFKWHTVARGETLATVARRFRVRRTDLAEANGLSAKARLRPGQELLIPRAPTTLLASRAAAPDAVPPIAARAVAGSKPSPAASLPDQPRVVHRVKRGDTLFGIARLYQTTVPAIKAWNRLRDNRIKPGDRLTIYTAQADDPTPQP